MKVLYFISYPKQATGSQRSLLTTVRNLPQEIDTHLLLTSEGYVQELFEASGISSTVIHPTGALKSYGKVAFQWSFFKKLFIFFVHYIPFQWKVWRFLRKKRFDILHCNSHRSTVLIALAAKLSGVKIVTHLRNEVRFRNIFTRVYETVSDKIITVSETILKDIAESNRQKAVTVYNGLEHPDLSSYQRHVSEKLRIICLSLVVPHKGLHHLIDAITYLHNKGFGEVIDVQCLGPFLEHHADYKAFLESKIFTQKLENFYLLGYKKDPFPYLAAADLVILPSISEEVLTYGNKTQHIIGNEGLPRVLLEACGFTKPAIAFDVPGVREIIVDGESGFIVEEGNVNALANAIQQFIENRELLNKMGDSARQIYNSKFTVRQNVESTMRVYNDLLS